MCKREVSQSESQVYHHLGHLHKVRSTTAAKVGLLSSDSYSQVLSNYPNHTGNGDCKNQYAFYLPSTCFRPTNPNYICVYIICNTYIHVNIYIYIFIYILCIQKRLLCHTTIFVCLATFTEFFEEIKQKSFSAAASLKSKGHCVRVNPGFFFIHSVFLDVL